MAYTPEQRREYQRNRYKRRMVEAKESLGGCCSRCGADDNLDFDHIDPSTRVANVSTLAQTASNQKFWAEVDKCQLLCRSCHCLKTSGGTGRKMVRLKCPICSTIFTKPHNKTHLVREGGKVTFCSRVCMGKGGKGGSYEPSDDNILEVYYKETY